MKKNHIVLPAILLLIGGLCASLSATAQDTTSRRSNNMQKQQQEGYMYRDLNGRDIRLRYDRQKKITYNVETGEPVDFYLNTTTGDTTYGRGQYIVNSYMMNNGGTWGMDTTRLRVSDKGVHMVNGNKKLKTEMPYQSYKAGRNRRDSL